MIYINASFGNPTVVGNLTYNLNGFVLSMDLRDTNT